MSKIRTRKLLARTIGGAMIASSAAVWLGGAANAVTFPADSTLMSVRSWRFPGPCGTCVTADGHAEVGPATVGVGLALNPQPLPPGLQGGVQAGLTFNSQPPPAA
ncbi:MAG: hypothetical protein JO161_06365 [Planctomycetaceae bacterium]|nr:hypothetical protein [Planctomycetaceae bacterium]